MMAWLLFAIATAPLWVSFLAVVAVIFSARRGWL